jgi:hypothetical protein
MEQGKVEVDEIDLGFFLIPCAYCGSTMWIFLCIKIIHT